MGITQANVREIFDYDPLTGEFRWKVSPGRKVAAGSIAGSKNKERYIQIRYRDVTYQAHRLAWLFVHGKWPDDQLDGNRARNAIANLREASSAQNMQNRRGAHRNSKTRLMGVTWHDRAKKYRATICHQRKQRHLGFYATPEEAHAAYLKAKAELHPFSTMEVK